MRDLRLDLMGLPQPTVASSLQPRPSREEQDRCLLQELVRMRGKEWVLWNALHGTNPPGDPSSDPRR